MPTPRRRPKVREVVELDGATFRRPATRSRNIEDRRNEGREHPSSLANRNRRRLAETAAEVASQRAKEARRKKKR